MRLAGWKQIAQHCDVCVRTVQQWEDDYNMPVRRGRGKRGRVFAIPDELDAWILAESAPRLKAAGKRVTVRLPAEKLLEIERLRTRLNWGTVQDVIVAAIGHYAATYPLPGEVTNVALR